MFFLFHNMILNIAIPSVTHLLIAYHVWVVTISLINDWVAPEIPLASIMLYIINHREMEIHQKLHLTARIYSHCHFMPFMTSSLFSAASLVESSSKHMCIENCSRQVHILSNVLLGFSKFLWSQLTVAVPPSQSSFFNNSQNLSRPFVLKTLWTMIRGLSLFEGWFHWTYQSKPVLKYSKGFGQDLR